MLKTNWYAVHTLSQSELKVKTYIEKTKLERNMDEKISEIIIPTDIEIQKKEGKRIEKRVKVFPGYILIKMILDDSSFEYIKRIPGVTNFVSSGNRKCQ